MIQRLYDADASGARSDELCDEVGIRVFRVADHDRNEPVHCPAEGCDWQTAPEAWRRSWSKRRIYPGKTIPAFTEYYERYPRSRGYTDRILLIDAPHSQLPLGSYTQPPESVRGQQPDRGKP